MEKDKVESRTQDELEQEVEHHPDASHDAIYSSSRPLVPQQGQALSRLLTIAADVARRKYLPDIEDCRTIGAARLMAASFSDDHSKLANDLKEVWDALTASRSEEATPDWDKVATLLEHWEKVWEGDKGKLLTEFPQWIVDAAAELFAHDVCDKWDWSDYTRAAAAIISRHAGAPAAGSTEPDFFMDELGWCCTKRNPCKVHALAGTDTDVAKGKL